MLGELREKVTQLEEKVGLLEQNLPNSKQQLNDALSHSKELEEKAMALEQ